MNYYDYIIVGGGASGLMMAYRMSNDAFFENKSILIIDKEKKNTNDKTWCYWETENDEWNNIVSATWKNIIFKSEFHSTEESIAPYEYKMIRSKDFYFKIWSHLETKETITFEASSVLSIHQLDKEARSRPLPAWGGAQVPGGLGVGDRDRPDLASGRLGQKSSRPCARYGCCALIPEHGLLRPRPFDRS